MHTQVDVKKAATRAWSGFCRYPVFFAKPIVLVLIASWGWTTLFTLHGHRVGAISGILGGLLSFVLSSVAYVLICAMYLRARAGGTPVLSQVSEVVRYRGLAGYIWTLFLRYLAWATVILPGMAVAFVILVVLRINHATVHTAGGISAAAGGATSTYVLIVFLASGAVAVIVISRYSLTLPMFAIAGGERPDLWDESVRLARAISSTIAAVAFVSAIPIAVDLVIVHLGRGHVHPANLVVLMKLLRALLLGAWNTWFVLLYLEIALQLLGEDETSGVTA